jgi:hypothetical protein
VQGLGCDCDSARARIADFPFCCAATGLTGLLAQQLFDMAQVHRHKQTDFIGVMHRSVCNDVYFCLISNKTSHREIK